MAYAVSVFFDAGTDRAVRDLWDAVEAEGISSFLSRGPYNPHLTLAIFDRVDVEPVRSAISKLAESQPVLPVALASIGVFPGAEGVVFLAATMTEALLELHRQVHALMAQCADAPVPYYLPNRWNPHCSVAYNLENAQMPATVTLCRRLIPKTIDGILTHIGLIETPAEVEVCRFDLRTPADGRIA